MSPDRGTDLDYRFGGAGAGFGGRHVDDLTGRSTAQAAHRVPATAWGRIEERAVEEALEIHGGLVGFDLGKQSLVFTTSPSFFNHFTSVPTVMGKAELRISMMLGMAARS